MFPGNPISAHVSALELLFGIETLTASTKYAVGLVRCTLAASPVEIVMNARGTLVGMASRVLQALRTSRDAADTNKMRFMNTPPGTDITG
jgi:hypothetical protein